MDTLTEQQQQILALEKLFFKTAGAKEEQIRAMGLSTVRYYQLLAQIIHTRAAMEADPVLVKRLRRIAHVP
jgi:hypothetical protein